MTSAMTMRPSALVLSLLAAGCGGAPPAAPPPATPVEIAKPAASAAPITPPKDGEWDAWSHDQKMAYMKSAVLPKMGALFRDHDAKTFAEPKCVLCHGGGVKDASFKMPNPELPKLDLSPAGMKHLQEKSPAMLDFMTTQVLPTMAQLVGEAPYDPKTQKGFGCLECHTPK